MALSNKEEQLEFSSNRAAWVNEQTEPNSLLEHQIEEIKLRGYTVIENHYDQDELQFIRNRIDELYQLQVNEIGDEKILYEIGDANIARQLLAYDERFLKYARNENVLALVKHFLGEYFVLYQQTANRHLPENAHTTTPWHRDLTFWHYTSSRPLAMSALHIIDDYTEENGGIYVLPGTQKTEPFPSYEYVDKNKVFLTPKAGSIVVFDSMMFHSPGVNKSNMIKRSMPIFYTLHLIRQEISLPRLLEGKWSDDPELRGFLGYNCMQQPTVKDWRLEKYKNRRKNLQKY